MEGTAAREYLYLLDEGLYRFGNATTSKLDQVRLHRSDVTTYNRNGVLWVISNGKRLAHHRKAPEQTHCNG
jgi:hypothetical protein